MDKYEKLTQIKECIDRIEEDVKSSCGNGCPDKETLMNQNILECLKCISEILEETVKDSDRTSPDKKRFFITDEQREQLNIKEKAKISEITNELNKSAVGNNSKKINAVWITDWLLKINMLKKDAKNNRVPTQKGTDIGIVSEQRISQEEKIYYVNLYSEKAQKFIYDNIESIVNFHYNENQYNHDFEIISYPENMSLHKFISENKEKNIIIMSVGSCNTTLEEGSYKTVLIYQKAHKVLQGSVITRSANKCILCGIKEATKAIKKPSDVIIISPTPLGFGYLKSANHDICEEIIDILTDKKCNIKIMTCEGMGYEIRNYINLLAKSV